MVVTAGGGTGNGPEGPAGPVPDGLLDGGPDTPDEPGGGGGGNGTSARVPIRAVMGQA
jgi:hypothetical protein